MAYLKTFFPDAFKSKDVNPLVTALIIYLIIGIVGGVVLGFLSKIPFLGIIFSLVGAVVGLYALVGIILSLLVFFKVIND